jgi:hypothetical protein
MSSYFTTVWTRDYSGKKKKKQQIDICGELVLEGTIDRNVVTHTTE